MKKILFLDTSVATLNIGDEIINASIKKNFIEIYKDNYIFNLPTHTKTFSWYQKILYKNRMRPYIEADFKFFCGTNALYSNMFRPLPNWNINLMDCSLYRDTILLGVGLGVNSNSINLYTKLLYKNILSDKYIHSVRDEKTKEYLKKIGFEAYNTGCPTLWGLTESHCLQIPEKKASKCVFTLTSYNADMERDKNMIEIIDRNYDDVYFFPQCIEDIKYLNILIPNHKYKMVSPNLASYKEFLEKGDVDYIGNRLHGGIFAIQNKIRSIIVAIDYRAIEMNKNYKFPCIKREDVNDELEILINKNWKTQILGVDFYLVDKWKRQFL